MESVAVTQINIEQLGDLMEAKFNKVADRIMRKMETPKPVTERLTTKQVEELLNIKRAKVADLREAGLIEGKRIGRTWSYDRASITNFLRG